MNWRQYTWTISWRRIIRCIWDGNTLHSWQLSTWSLRFFFCSFPPGLQYLLLLFCSCLFCSFCIQHHSKVLCSYKLSKPQDYFYSLHKSKNCLKVFSESNCPESVQWYPFCRCSYQTIGNLLLQLFFCTLHGKISYRTQNKSMYI